MFPLLWVSLFVSASLTGLIFCFSLDPILEVLKKYVIWTDKEVSRQFFSCIYSGCGCEVKRSSAIHDH